jgi:hypothetical protein
MHTLSKFPDVFVATDETAPGVLTYIVETDTVETVEPEVAP